MKGVPVTKLEAVAAELGCTMGQLAIAWAAHNPRVSTVITGASRMSQLQENLGALQKTLPAQALAELDKLFAPPKRKVSLEML